MSRFLFEIQEEVTREVERKHQQFVDEERKLSSIQPIYSVETDHKYGVDTQGFSSPAAEPEPEAQPTGLQRKYGVDNQAFFPSPEEPEAPHTELEPTSQENPPQYNGVVKVEDFSEDVLVASL